MSKILAFLLLVAGVVRVWFDWQETISQADPFRFAPIGQIWFEFHRDSLLIIQPVVERYISIWLWEAVISQVFLAPLAPVLFGLAAIIYLIGRWRKSRRA